MENLPEKPIKNSSPVFNFLEQDKDIVISFLTRYARKDEVFNEINFDNMKYFYCEKTGDKYITIGSIGDVNNKSYSSYSISIFVNYAVFFRIPIVFIRIKNYYNLPSDFEYVIYIPFLDKKINKDVFEKRNYKSLELDNQTILYFTGENKEKGFYLASSSDIVEKSFEFYLQSFTYAIFPSHLFHDICTLVTRITKLMESFILAEFLHEVREFILNNIEKRQKYICRGKEEISKYLPEYLDYSYMTLEIIKEGSGCTKNVFILSGYPRKGGVSSTIIKFQGSELERGKMSISFDIFSSFGVKRNSRLNHIFFSGEVEEGGEVRELLDSFSLLKGKRIILV